MVAGLAQYLNIAVENDPDILSLVENRGSALKWCWKSFNEIDKPISKVKRAKMGVLGGRKDAPHFTFLLTASGQALSQKPVGTRAHDVVSLGETDNVLYNPSSRTFAP